MNYNKGLYTLNQILDGYLVGSGAFSLGVNDDVFACSRSTRHLIPEEYWGWAYSAGNNRHYQAVMPAIVDPGMKADYQLHLRESWNVYAGQKLEGALDNLDKAAEAVQYWQKEADDIIIEAGNDHAEPLPCDCGALVAGTPHAPMCQTRKA